MNSLRRVTKLLVTLLMLLLLAAPAFSQPASVAATPVSLRYDGVYQSSSYLGRGLYYYSYYRFFPNGNVTAYSGPFAEKPGDIFKALEIAPSGRGTFTQHDQEVTFSLAYSKGTIDYNGKLTDDKLALTFHSNITNTDGTTFCEFLPVASSVK